MSAANIKRKFAELVSSLSKSIIPHLVLPIFLDINGDPVEISADNPLPTSGGAGKSVIAVDASATTGATTIQFIGTPTTFQIIASSTFSCTVSVSMDGTNFVAFDSSPATVADIYFIDPYHNAWFKFNFTANAGTVSVVLS